MTRRALSQPSLVLLVAVALAAVAFSLARPSFLSAGNAFNIAEQTAVISLVAFGMTAVILTRGIDLSVGSSLALASVVGGQVMHATGGSAAATIAAVFGTALLVGALNGLLVAVFGVNAFMATLGTYALAGGAAVSISRGASTNVGNDAVLWLGRADVAGVPVSTVLTVVVLAAFYVLTRRTVLGRWWYAAGGNRTAAVASGIPVRWATFVAYLTSGLTVGLGALVTIGRLSSIQPLAGQGLEFSAITAAVIGGTSLAGGRGDVVATFLGSVFVGVISAGLSFLGVSQAMIYVLTGVFVVVAVLVSQREVFAALGERYATARAVLANRLGRLRRPGRGARRGAAVAGSEDQRVHRLEVEGVSKMFPGVVALEAVGFSIESGEVVALMGENGAGKSTLVKILSGNYRPSAGGILLDGTPVRHSGPEDARRAGIAVIHQHFTLVPDLTVAENMFIGEELRWWPFGPLRRRLMRSLTRDLLRELDVPVSPRARVGALTVGQRQMIEIAKAIHERAWLVIMDEPTSALSARERDRLYEFVDRLRRRGTAILYISHKLEEIYHLASRAVVLRDGQVVGRPSLAEVAPGQLVSMMVGRRIENLFPYVAADVGEDRLSVSGLSDGGLLKDVTLTVREGEVVGFVGLMGSGRTELMRCVVGLSPVVAGTVRVMGRKGGGLSLAELAGLGVAYVPEDRLADGIFPDLSVAENMGILWIRQASGAGLLQVRRERERVDELISDLAVRPPDPRRQIRFLSGGNQQKVVLGKWLALRPKLFLLDDPTRGVDVGAKAEIHDLIAGLKSAGAAVLLTSSEMPEVLSVADRVVVMRHGVSVAEYPRGVSEEQVMRDAFGERAAAPAPGEAAVARHTEGGGDG
ncbi:MAG: ATP-binding cassette domain-containing protein [Streptosporangiales bacterium]|nr:ATP-binding cassette domain-containing protein [Streptosporangiales bacterium]